ncbi:ZIP family metal transporter [Sphingomonas metalli]|uniref:ZIP family metal transporter n=1 Tax=Sphingomonas metalli TaxID=1779358 RepID=A0A916SZN6_9SPHN|nr:ZIP family metal transporter [Sphingomonas metalli]GGB25040.1 ZIP family metal transporter [Sphingomonas metalli]
MDHLLLPLGIGIAASAATLLGGLIALRFHDRISLVLGLAAGIVLGVALIDLVPEALELGRGLYDPRAILAWVAAGFAGYMLLDRGLGALGQGASPWRDHLGPASLTLHSFLDGMGIGLAFQMSPEIGWVLALAVLTHDVADGVNTVSLSLTGSRPALARRWLLANGLAPLTGVIVGLAIRLPGSLLAPILGAFGGVFLFIGSCELVPRARLRDPRLRATLATVAGLALMLVVTRLAH